MPHPPLFIYYLLSIIYYLLSFIFYLLSFIFLREDNILPYKVWLMKRNPFSFISFGWAMALFICFLFSFCERMISPLQRTPITKFRFFHTISAICKKRFLIISLHLRRCIKSDTFKNPLSCVLFRDAFFLVQNM